MQEHDSRPPVAADCVLVFLQRYIAAADRQRRCGTGCKTPESDFRPRFSRGAARSPLDLLHDAEFRGELPRARQCGDTVRLKGNGEPSGTERSKGPREQSADNVHVFAGSGADPPPTSIIGYRAAAHATNPADVMLPCIITSFIGTVAALVLVGIRQRINLFKATIVIAIGGIAAVIGALLVYITRLDLISKSHFTGNLSNGLLLGLIFAIFGYSLFREKQFAAKGTTIFNSFVEGAYNGLAVGRIIFPYILGMLVAISLFRNSGLFEMFAAVLARTFRAVHVNDEIVNALPIAILRPFSSAGSRGFLLDAMGTYGADSFTGRLACVFQCAAETTFYVIAVYFGSVKIKNTRYALSTMLLVDLICVFAAIFVCVAFFKL